MGTATLANCLASESVKRALEIGREQPPFLVDDDERGEQLMILANDDDKGGVEEIKMEREWSNSKFFMFD